MAQTKFFLLLSKEKQSKQTNKQNGDYRKLIKSNFEHSQSKANFIQKASKMVENRGTRVYVGNLGEKVKKEDLETEFNKFGKLNNIWVAFNPPGFAFVEFESRNDAEKACDILNGTEILGSGKLRVEISKGRPKGRRDSRQGGGGGRFGGPPSRFGGSGGGGGGGSGGRPQSFRRSDDFRGSSGGGRFQSDSFSRGRSRDFSNGSSSYGGGGNRFSRDRFGSSGGSGSFNRNGGQGGGRFRSRSPRSRF